MAKSGFHVLSIKKKNQPSVAGHDLPTQLLLSLLIDLFKSVSVSQPFTSNAAPKDNFTLAHLACKGTKQL